MSYKERVEFLKRIQKLQQEMEAMWIHIRNLEEKLLNPSEIEDLRQENSFMKAQLAEIETVARY